MKRKASWTITSHDAETRRLGRCKVFEIKNMQAGTTSWRALAMDGNGPTRGMLYIPASDNCCFDNMAQYWDCKGLDRTLGTVVNHFYISPYTCWYVHKPCEQLNGRSWDLVEGTDGEKLKVNLANVGLRKAYICEFPTEGRGGYIQEPSQLYTYFRRKWEGCTLYASYAEYEMGMLTKGSKPASQLA